MGCLWRRGSHGRGEIRYRAAFSAVFAENAARKWELQDPGTVPHPRLSPSSHLPLRPQKPGGLMPPAGYFGLEDGARPGSLVRWRDELGPRWLPTASEVPSATTSPRRHFRRLTGPTQGFSGAVA